MENEEYIIQWDDMTPEAKAKKERLEQDPSFRTDHMAYMEGMDQISTDIRDKVMSQVESYDEKVYTAADVQAALAHDVSVPSRISRHCFHRRHSHFWNRWQKKLLWSAATISATVCIFSHRFILPITVKIIAFTVVLTVITIFTARN